MGVRTLYPLTEFQPFRPDHCGHSRFGDALLCRLVLAISEVWGSGVLRRHRCIEFISAV